MLEAIANIEAPLESALTRIRSTIAAQHGPQ
jgi:hypothetical protein